MFNKIDLAVFQEGEGGELKSETVWTKVSGLLREALGPLALAFSDKVRGSAVLKSSDQVTYHCSLSYIYILSFLF